jgi:hypothetical protein
MNNTPTPIWRPISFLPTFTQLIDGTLQETKEQLDTLAEARPQPYVLDDALVARVIRCYGETATYIPLYKEQLDRWEKLDLSVEQGRDVKRLKRQVQTLSQVVEAILSLAGELKENTIDAILRKDDAELAADVLTGRIPSPPADQSLTEQQVRLASLIDTQVQNIIANGDSDEDILRSMSDYMDTFKQLMDSSTPDEMKHLCDRFSGFYRFGKLLEALAQGIQDGRIQVP